MTCPEASPFCVEGTSAGCSSAGPDTPNAACTAAHGAVSFRCTGAGLFPG